MRRAEPRAREHRDGQLGDHPQVDRDRRPLAHTELLERVREAHDAALEVGVGDRLRVAGLALPVVGDALAEPGLDVPVDAVEAGVQLPADVPLRVRRLPLAERLPGLEPGQPAGLGAPELLEVALVDVRLHVRLGGELRGRRVAALLGEKRVDLAQGARSYG